MSERRAKKIRRELRRYSIQLSRATMEMLVAAPLKTRIRFALRLVFKPKTAVRG